MSDMNIAIIGPGAIGLLLAGFLHQNSNITLVDYRADRAELLKRNGIRWEGGGKDIQIQLPVICTLKETEGFDLVILCVKAYQTESAALGIKDAGYSGPLLTLQNGLGNVEILSKYNHEAKILAGITSEGSTLLGPGHVRHAGRGKTAFGPIKPGKPGNDFIENIVKLFKASGIEAEISSDSESLIWSKLLINVGINALTGILRVQNGMLLEISHAKRLMSALVNEALEVARHKKIAIPFDDAIARVEEVCRLTSSNFSSMYQDLKHKRPTEIDFINGAVVKEGKTSDILCPFNETVTSIIRGLETVNRSEA